MRGLDDRALRGLQAFAGGVGPGDVLDDRWEIAHRLGEGGMGVVHAARDRETGEEVAIKVLLPQGAAPSDEARFDREIAALASVAHPAIVRYLAHGKTAAGPYVVMERLVGCTLADRLRRGALSSDDAAVLGARLAGGLAALHRAGITHRDVKPSNVFLVDESVLLARLVDLGVARRVDVTALTRTGALIGTPGYMAPEQVRADRDLGPAADLFSLGCVLWECVTGRPAFEGETYEQLFARILLEQPRVIDESSLAALVARMLEKDPQRRPSASEVEVALSATPPPRAAASSSPLAGGISAGTVIGNYRVESLLGTGGMGIVFAARHLELGTRVALKFLHPEQRGDDARFLREARAAFRLESAHVARVLDVARTDEWGPYIVMEHLSGADLAQRLAREGPLPVEVAVTYVLETCEAIAEAHALGIVHRDLKPSNLFVTDRRDGSEIVKVLDFGISKVVDQRGDVTRPMTETTASVVIGSTPYMSPEQVKGESVDTRTDIWSIGIVLHELLTNTRPFHAPSSPAIAARIAGSPPTRLREVLPGAPAALEAVILRCLEKEPARRYPTLAAFARALESFAPRAAAPSVARVVRLLGEPVTSSWRGDVAPARGARPLVLALLALAGVGGGAYAMSIRTAVPDPAPATPDFPPAPSIAPVPPSASASEATAGPAFSTAAPPSAGTKHRPLKRRPSPHASDSAPRPLPGELDLRDPSLEKR